MLFNALILITIEIGNVTFKIMILFQTVSFQQQQQQKSHHQPNGERKQTFEQTEKIKTNEKKVSS